MLAVYLWKEWRVFRPTLIALAVMALLVCPLVLLLPGVWTPGDFVGKVMVCAMLAISITIGAELLPYERTAQRMQFLGRLPGGERMAFAAKLVFLLSSLLVFTGFCYLIAQGSALFIRPGFASPVDRLHIVIVLAGIIVCLWAFAISSWIKHATLVLPILAILLVFGLRPLLESPLLKAWEYIGVWDLILYFVMMTGGAVLLAWTSYLHLLGKSRGTRLRSGAIVGICLIAPWGLGAWQVGLWFTPNPDSEHFRISSGFIGTGHRYAFLNTSTGNAFYRGFVVDLENGEWRVEGGFETRFLTPGMLDGHVLISGLVGEHDFLRLYDPNEGVCYDGETSKPFDIGTREQIRARQAGRIRKSKQQTTPIRLPDGRPAWIMDRTLETHDSEGNIERLEWSFFPEGRVGMLKGLGIRIFRSKRSSILDLVRERIYPIEEGRRAPTLVLKKGWLIKKDDQHFLYDPDLENLNEATPLDASDHIVERVGDNQVLSYRKDKIYVVDLGTGEREEIPTHRVPAEFRFHRSQLFPRVLTRTKEGTLLIQFNYRTGSRQSIPGVSMFDLKARTFGPFIEGSFRPMSFPSDNIMLAIADQKRIERVNLVTGEREVLFPRN